MHFPYDVIELGRCKMKKSTYLAMIALVMIIALLSLAARAQKSQSQSAEVLLGAALHQEEVEGNFEAAIETYKKILADYPDNRPLAARALLQMGRCYEKLGKSGARMAYERLVRDYADQADQVKLARNRLASLLKPPSASKEPAFATRKVWALPDIGNVEGAPSPDGRYFSFTDWETGDLAIRDLETGTNRRLTDKGPWEKSEEFADCSRWSPDSSQIAYDWYDVQGYMELRVIAVAGGKPRILVDCGNDEWMRTFDWSPDGQQILIFLEKEDATRQIVLVSATDGAAKVIKTFGRRGRFPNIMRFSGDGRYIAYDQPQEENAAERDIFLIPVDGGQEVVLVEHPAHDLLLGWPPDGKGILFASDRTGSLDIWFLPVSGGKAQGPPELVRRGIEQIVPLGFTQKGSFYYAQGGSMFDAYVARMDRQTGKILGPPEKVIKRFEGANSWPEYSPDGKYLAYLSTRSHRFQAANFPNVLCIRSLENTAEREFSTRFRRLAGLRWAPDGKSIYLAAWDDQGMGIYQADTQTGTMIPIVRDEGPQRIHAHSVSPDGKTLIYERRYKVEPKEPYRILSRDLTTGEEKELYSSNAENGWLQAALSPDGEKLAIINWNKRKTLRLIPAKGGEPRDLLKYEDAHFFTCLEWTADGKHILFSRAQSAKDGPRISLWRISADGGEPRELGLEMANFENLSVHPDGVHLAFSSVGSTMKSPSVLVMENFLPPALAAPETVTMTARMIEDPPGDTPNCRVSPDGRNLTFVDWDKNNVFVRDLQTGKDRQLTDEGRGGDEFQGAVGTAAWSSDGKKIAYAWSFRRGRTLIRRELRVVGVDGGKPRILAEFKGSEAGGELIWSPDEKYLATTLYPENGSPGIVLISTEDGSVRRLTDLKREIWPTNQVFSPDSRHIAYDRLPDENSPERDIYLVSVETGQDIPLVRHPADDYLLGWSRDGKWLVFASDRTGTLGLWVVGVSGTKTEGEPKLVKPGIDRILPVGMTRDGALYYGVVRAAEDIFIVDLDPRMGMVAGPPRKAIEQFEGGNFTPAYSPDGKYMAYVSRRGNSPYPTNVGNALCIRSLETGKERVFYKEIWKLGLRHFGVSGWSPDSKSILFVGSGGISRSSIYRFDLETEAITPIVGFGPDERSMGGIYGPDGKCVFLRANVKEGFSQIVARDLDSGEEQELYRVPKLDRISTVLSPDGRWLSFINMGWGGVRSLKIMPSSGGEAREIWNFGEVKQGVPGISHTWSSDGRYILLAAPDFADLRAWYLWRVPVEGGMPPENMGLEWEKWGIWDLTAHPDGTKLAFAGRGAPSDESELWVLENFLPPAKDSK
jgi:Tol biopolymer transport system component